MFVFTFYLISFEKQSASNQLICLETFDVQNVKLLQMLDELFYFAMSRLQCCTELELSVVN